MTTRPRITFDEHVTIDGVPALIQAGTLHYFRLPHPGLWTPVLHRMRAGGLNAVVVPFPWAYHSPAPGLYDFTGPRDVGRLLDATEEAGLWLIPGIGPWIDAGLNAGGQPAWFLNTPNVCPDCESAVPAGPSFPFVRYVKEWWSRLLPHFAARPNLLMVALNPGRCAGGQGLPRYTRALMLMAREFGINVPLAAPRLHIPVADGNITVNNETAIIPIHHLEAGHNIDPSSVDGLTIVETGPISMPDGAARARMIPQPGEGEVRSAISQLLRNGATSYAHAPTHAGINWAYWGTSGDCTATGTGAPLGEGAALTPSYFDMRRRTSTAETLHNAIPIAPLQTGEHVANLLPANWDLAGGYLLATTLEPVLRTAVAGRHLLVLANEDGGDLLLSDDFRPQHARGPVRTQRVADGLAIRFEAARWTSLLLDGPEGPLQLLALNPHFAARVWPLDDTWRTTPAFPAAWHPAPEDPARGLVIGPELVQPRADGGYDFLVAQKGFGYRWGPWRGSDPRTWLAPLTWRNPPPVTLPPLTWASRAGAPEILPGVDDQTWFTAPIGAAPAPRPSQSADGFTWYRGHFAGAANAVTLYCDQACDVFLNGAHIAALNTASQTARGLPKTIPLPPHLLQAQNVLAILVEDAGRQCDWEATRIPRGLAAVNLDSGASIHWRMRRGLSGEQTAQGFPGYADWALVPDDGAAHITWHRAAFVPDVPDGVEVPLFLYLDQTPKRAYIFLNGQLVGRYREERGAQHRFWLPGGILRWRAINELLVAQWTRGAQPGIGVARLEHGGVMRWYKS